MKGTVEIGARQRHGERKTQARLVQLIDRDDHERSRLRLLGPTRRIGVGPIDLTLLRAGVYHSGVGASKEVSISALSAR